MIKTTISMLGLKARDRVTGFEGVISTVSFDLYGCVQAVVTPPIGADGKRREGEWFDIKRLETGKERAMDAPDFGKLKFGQEAGAAERPSSMPRGY